MNIGSASAERSLVADDPAVAPPRRSRRLDGGTLLRVAEAYALLGLTVALVVLFSLLPATRDTFPTAANLQATLGNQSVLAIVALAALIPLVAQAYDFSVGATMGLASILAATVLSSGSPIVVALAIAVAVGLAVGVVNGLLVTRAGVSSVVVTLGTATIVQGAVSWKTGGQSIVNGISTALTDFGSGDLLGVPLVVYVALVVACGVYFLLRHTPYGRYVQALGSNANAARLVGLNVNRLTLSTFVIAGALAGGAGLLQVARSGAGNPQVGAGFTLPAIAAAFLSVAAIKPGRFNVWGTIVAILFLSTLNSGLNLAGVSSYVNDFANGTALIAGVALAGVFGRRRAGGA
ncbi:MAG TPA: ABC transporter permease [Conexibacter sp.]|jgi:ribose transport system permease protein|nr:ABC transporter permease [Conexibacter sp.]